MAGRFIDAEVEVRLAQRPGPPTSFVRGREDSIAAISEFRRTLDFKSARWRRRHRDWCAVRTADGRAFELYFRRGPGRPCQVLLREL